MGPIVLLGMLMHINGHPTSQFYYFLLFGLITVVIILVICSLTDSRLILIMVCMSEAHTGTLGSFGFFEWDKEGGEGSAECTHVVLMGLCFCICN